MTYNLVVEGVLAETGHFSFQRTLTDFGILPGMQVVVGHLRRDESRHLAYGVYLLSRLVAEHGDRSGKRSSGGWRISSRWSSR